MNATELEFEKSLIELERHLAQFERICASTSGVRPYRRD